MDENYTVAKSNVQRFIKRQEGLPFQMKGNSFRLDGDDPSHETDDDLKSLAA